MNWPNELIIGAQKSISANGFQLYGFSLDFKEAAISITMQKHNECVIPPVLCTISNKSAQLLFNDLWMAGLRPDKYDSDAGELKATKLHLEDMRKLVDKKELHS